MKKIKIFLVFLFIIFVLLFVLIKNNVIIFSKGKIDGIKYSSLEKVEIKNGRIEDAGKNARVNLENKEVYEQYELKTFNNTVYYNCNFTPLEEKFIEEKIGEEFDYEKNKVADIYSIKDISKDIAVALKFEDSTNYFTYINQQCPERTLGEFLNEYNIKIEDLNFTSVDYTKLKNNKKFVLKTEEISEEVRNLIFNNLNVKLENYYEEIGNQLIRIYTNNNIYGEGLDIYITEENKLILNIQAIKKSLAFDLEEGALEEIIENIKKEENNKLIVYFKKFELFGSSIIDS